jgi:murein DD-endopeptidase MepM/ murein hydrolase activator NlpD
MKFRWQRILRNALLGLLSIVVVGLVLPQGRVRMPVEGATSADYDAQSFWFSPWGASGVHKGVDIFAAKGTPVHPATSGIVVQAGQNPDGGNVVSVLGPKWRIHYYAHLDTVLTHVGAWARYDVPIGRVGTTGNAQGKQPHLHYSICSVIPYPWLWSSAEQGWKRMFYLNPIDMLR